jgi:NADH-quinone oxidoreductase subunit E
MLIRNIEAALNIKVGETSQDGRFLLKHIPCPGFCEKGPMFRINDSVFEELDPEDVQPILNTYLMLAL